jgi:hypothetical protein
MSLTSNPHSLLNKCLDFALCYLRIFKVVKIAKRKSEDGKKQNKHTLHDDLSLTELMNNYGSDKGSHHGYTEIYESILREKKDNIKVVIEIGIGTNNPNLDSNMGVNGKPGASLRAWRDYFSNSTIYGFDVDRNILFSEPSILTGYVDQLEPKTFEPIKKLINRPFDLVIVDGLHTPRADFNTLIELLPNLNVDGDFFIEDVGNLALDLFWPPIFLILRKRYLVTTHLSREGKVKTGNIIHITKK